MAQIKLTPVDDDPFDADQAAMMPETFVPQGMHDWAKQAAPKDFAIIRGAVEGLASLPQRAFRSSEAMQRGEGYDPGPILEAAMLPMGAGVAAGAPAHAGEALLGAGPVRVVDTGQESFFGILNRTAGAPAAKQLELVDQAGEPVGLAHVTNHGDTIHIEHIESFDGSNTFGHAAMRSIIRQLSDMFPSATKVTGNRVSGARFSGATVENEAGKDASLNLRPRLTPVDHDPFEEKL